MADVIRLPGPDSEERDSLLFGATELIGDLLVGGEDLDFSVRFGDDVWDLAGHRSWKEKQGRQTKISFARISPRWRALAKEMALLQIRPDLAPERAPGMPMAETWPQVQESVGLTTAQSNIKMLSSGLSVVDRQGITTFDSDDWARLALLLAQPADTAEKQKGARLSSTTVRGRVRPVVGHVGNPAHLFAVEVEGGDGLVTVEDVTALSSAAIARRMVYGSGGGW